ncbi:MAG: transporter permease [Herbinix sp.]|jgi:ABC-type transport system involved in multi-copper enzyme maturation permease subunit|nr:transporter permease [Herbinix sp.]
MISYIKSEFYRMLHSKGSYLFILICSVLLVSANVVLAVVGKTEENFPYNNTSFSLSLFYSYLPIVFLLCVSVASIVFSNEYTNHTMKNSISYGISRGSIYFGKLITEVVYAVIALLAIAGFYIGSAYLLLENSHSGDPEVLVRAYFVALPLLLFALATTNCFLFIIESTGGAITAIMVVLLAFPMVSNFLGMKFELFRKLSEILPWNLVSNMTFSYEKYQMILPWDGTTGYLNYWLYGGLWMTLFVLIGFFVFRKKEIK